MSVGLWFYDILFAETFDLPDSWSFDFLRVFCLFEYSCWFYKVFRRRNTELTLGFKLWNRWSVVIWWRNFRLFFKSFELWLYWRQKLGKVFLKTFRILQTQGHFFRQLAYLFFEILLFLTKFIFDLPKPFDEFLVHLGKLLSEINRRHIASFAFLEVTLDFIHQMVIYILTHCMIFLD